MCEAMLGGTSSTARLLELLAENPLDRGLLKHAAELLPASLEADDVVALRRFLLRQAEWLGARTR